MKHIKYSVSVTALLAASYSPLAAQHSQDTGDNVEEIIVSSRPIQSTTTDLAQSISVLAGEELDRLRSVTLGETLDSLPGISQTSFGPSASRPIIRGLGGDRIRTLINGIGSIDVSTTSPDHAVAIDTGNIEKIEVLRGPATLLFGNNAAAGVVNVFDGRIPTQIPEGGVDGQASAEYGTNGDEFNTAGSVNFQAADNLVLHFDASYLDRGDIDIPGFAISDELAAQLIAEGEGEIVEEQEEGTVANTAQERYSGSVGASYVGDDSYFGVNVSYFNNVYGLPVSEEEEEEGGEGEPEGEEEGISIDQEQIRVDLAGEFPTEFLIFERTKIRAAYADYEQLELEGDEVGTLFSNEGFEARLELVQRESDGLKGAWGFQFRDRDFSAIGEEAFVPPNNTTQFGIFGLEQYELGNWLFEGGARIEFQNIESDDTGFDENYTGISFSGSAIYNFDESWQFAVAGFRTERAPNAEETLSNGPHLATGLFEIGDPTLGEETGLGLDVSLRKNKGDITGEVNFFITGYDDFIFENITDDIEDGLPVAIFQATDARFWGFEADFRIHVVENDDYQFHIDTGFDFVRATDTDNDVPLPRIPAFSARVGGVFQADNWDAYTTLEWTDSQNRVGQNQLPTDDFFNLTAGITYHPFGSEGPVHFYVEGRNLFDEEIRFATSFLQATVPAPGVNVRFGGKFTF